MTGGRDGRGWDGRGREGSIRDGSDVSTRHVREGAEREELQKMLARWGTAPVSVAPSEGVEERRQRGVSTLRAAIGSAKRDDQARRTRVMLGAAAAVALAVWGGFQLTTPSEKWAGRTPSTIPQTAASSPLGVPALGAPGPTVGRSHAVVEGAYEVYRSGDGWGPNQPGRALTSGDRIRALAEPIDVSLDRITSARIAGGSMLAIAALETHRQELTLLQGSAEFEVDPKRAAEVIVHAAGARIRVTGTEFSVATGGSHSGAWSEVVVKLGRVEIFAQNQVFVVEAGQSWSSREVAPGRLEGAFAIAGARKASGNRSMVRTRGASGDASLAGDPALGAAPDDASTTLSEENRLFRTALSARNSGSHGRCVALLSDFLTKFPSSPLRQEAMVAQFRCQRSGAQTAAARRTALRYLSEYPSGFARDEARTLVLDGAR